MKFRTFVKSLFVMSKAASTIAQSSLALHPHEFRPLLVTKVTKLTHDAKLFEIAFPHKDQELGMSTSGYVVVKGTDKPGTNEFGRGPRQKAYTPVSLNDQKGSFELLVRSYPTGNISKYLDTVKVGEYIEVRGPELKLAYIPNMKRRVGMIAGGTGIAPMIQFIKEIVNNPNDHTQINLLYSDRTPSDILLKDYLDVTSEAHPEKLTVQYTLTGAASTANNTHSKRDMHSVSTSVSGSTDVEPVWPGSLGRIDVNKVRQFLPPPSQDTLILICGSKGFVHDLAGSKTRDKQQGEIGGVLKEAGYSAGMVYKF